MLTELRVRDLGVIADAHLVFGSGVTALTGETGAGKTLLVEAIELLVGGRAEPSLVRAGATEALVEGRFVSDDEERVVTRVIPADGRSRAYLDGRLATAATLAEAGARLVDLHGQHAHQSLLSPATQRQALDRFGQVDLGLLLAVRVEQRRVAEALAALGGDARSRARELDLLRYQLDEIDAAGLRAADEDEVLARDEEMLADAAAHREAAAAALEAMGDGGARDALATAVTRLAGRGPFRAVHDRLATVAVELDDLVHDLRVAAESVEDDPARLAEIQARRHLLAELRRKYGSTLGEVMAFRDEVGRRLADLGRHDQRVADLEREAGRLASAEREAAAVVASARRAAAPLLSTAVEHHLRSLAMPKAAVAVEVGGADPGDEVSFQLAANPGQPSAPLSKAASGGELARTMLALRLVLTEAPDTLVFDEVDAGVGGEAALALGRSLAALGRRHQVLVVTHLPQVAACADHQIGVTKRVVGGVTTAEAAPVEGPLRVEELARMLSGMPDSATARQHAAELLATATGV